MYIENEGFISDIFNGPESTSNIGDVRQTFEYNLVKSYPSVNSSNGGQIHSEENVRWLTRQFVKKPFIIQYDNNNMNEFNYSGAVLNAGTSTGGMVNIDGYIINTAEEMSKLSFDNSEDTLLGTNANGYIYHTTLQKAFQSFLYGGSADDIPANVTNGLLDSDITGYIQNAIHNPSWNWDTKKKDFLINFVNGIGNTFDIAGRVQIIYTDDILTYIKNHKETLPGMESSAEIQPSDNNPYIYQTNVNYEEDPPYVQVIYNVNYGYIKDKWNYEADSTIEYEVQEVDPDTGETHIVTKEFPNYTPTLFIKDIFGFLYVFQSNLDVLTNCFPGQLNTDMNFLEDTVTPGKDVVGQRMIFQINNMYDMSKCYDSYTSKNCNIVNYVGDTMQTQIKSIPGTSNYGEFPVGINYTNTEEPENSISYDRFFDTYLETLYGCKYLYTLTTSEPSDWGTATYYTKSEVMAVISFSPAPLTDTWEANKYYKKSYNENYRDFQIKLPTIDSAVLSTNHVKHDDIRTEYFTQSGAVFNIKTAENIFKLYRAYESVDITSELIEGRLKLICDEYYCLPLDKIHTDFNEIFALKVTGTSTPVPVGFIASNGALMANNIEYTKIVDGNEVRNVLVEGYASLLRRICKIVTGKNDERTYGHGEGDNFVGGDISNSNIDSLGWRLLIKDFQTGVLQGSTTISDYTTICDIFEVNSIQELNFDIIYNKLIAPYMNFYLQLSWSAILDKTVLENSEVDINGQFGKYKAREAYTVMKEAPLPSDVEIHRDDGDVFTLRIPRKYTVDGATITAKKDVEYVYQKFTDVERLTNFLCTPDTTYVSSSTDTNIRNHNLSYHTKININDVTDKFNLFEDYISYIRKCTQRSWDYNLQDSNHSEEIKRNVMTIPYKITSLDPIKEGNIYYYGFKTLDKDSNNHNIFFDDYTRYTNKFYTNNEAGNNYDYANVYKGNNENCLIDIQPGYIQNVCIRTDNFTPYRILTYDFFYPQRYPNGSSDPINVKVTAVAKNDPYIYKINPLQIPNYTMWLDSYITRDYAGQQEGASGFCGHGTSQGWTVCVPMILRLYKDGQNYLNGRLGGTLYHNGIYVDYKLPCEVTNDDFWFANSWLGNVRSVGIWEIENSVVKKPTAIDGMNKYLDKRNRTLFDVDTIYSTDKDGNYITLEEYIKKVVVEGEIVPSGGGSSSSYEQLEEQINSVDRTVNSRIDTVTTVIGSQPSLNYVDYPAAASVGRIVTTKRVRGLIDNVSRLKTYVDNMSYQARTTPSYSSNELYIANNRYYNLTNYANSTLKIVTPPEDVMDSSSTTFNERYVINTTNIDNSNGVIKTTVKVSKSSVAFESNLLELRLGSIINKFNDAPVSNALRITWSSNYKVEYDETTSEYVIYIEDKLSDTLNCLLELTIIPDKENGKASGYVNVLTYSNENTLTLMDMNYLWRELYSIENISWSHLSEITRAGLAPKFYNLGDTKTFEVTYDGKTYNIPATIIGFDAENVNAYDKGAYPHTITWMTDIHGTQDIINIEDVQLFNWEINPDIDVFDPSDESAKHDIAIYGYNYYEYNNDIFPLSTTFYINRITRYANTEFINTVVPMRKTTGFAYTCKSTAGVYKVVKAINSGTIGTGNTLNNKINALKFWLPSVSELGLSYTIDDPVEAYIQSQATIPLPEYSRTSSVVTLNAKINDVNTSFVVNETNARNVVYPYFELPSSEQNIGTKLIVLSSFYDVNYDLTSEEDQDTFITQYKTLSPIDVGFRNKFDSCSRYQYIAYKDNPHSSSLVVRPKALTTTINSTDFCFTTG